MSGPWPWVQVPSSITEPLKKRVDRLEDRLDRLLGKVNDQAQTIDMLCTVIDLSGYNRRQTKGMRNIPEDVLERGLTATEVRDQWLDNCNKMLTDVDAEQWLIDNPDGARRIEFLMELMMDSDFTHTNLMNYRKHLIIMLTGDEDFLTDVNGENITKD